MLVGHFGYSDDEAYRRISAMKLVQELPEVEEKINSGELSLSHLGLAQSYFRQEQKIQNLSIDKTFKLELLNKISEQPIREAKRICLMESSGPDQRRPDKISNVSEEKIELRFTADRSLEEKITELKGLLAHKHPKLSLSELFEILCDMGLENIKFAKMPKATMVSSHAKNTMPKFAASRKQSAKESCSKIRRNIFQQANHQCSNCHSTYALEVDHIQPKAKGGNNSKNNLRLLCRSCNQRAAIQLLGQAKMDLYLN